VRVRHVQARLVDHLRAVQQQVEIENARTPAIAAVGRALAAEAALDVEQRFQQRPRVERRFQLGDGVDEGGLVLAAPGCGAIKA
jgi:hypothetical protein